MMFAFSGTINSGIHNLRTEQAVDVAIDVTTAPMVYAADVVLDSPLFSHNINQVISIESTEAETPGATAYDENTQTLTVGELLDDETRDLTVVYYTEVTDQMMPVVGPFLPFLVFGGIVAAIVFSIWKGRK
jgi:hypothetical protein